MLWLFRIPFFKVLFRKTYFVVVKFHELYLTSLLAPQKEVLSGIFKGLKYPSYRSFGSSLLPKLLGSYEDELHLFFQKFSQNKYSDIVDVGCAEGYYAVGLALLFPEAKVCAYDISPKALNLCKKMAILNKTYDRTDFKQKCDRDVLLNFQVKGRGLLICDCEGYESELFDKDGYSFTDLHLLFTKSMS